MSTLKSASCQVPSKLILCGEHSVLFGTPALSMAINLPTTCDIQFTPLDDTNNSEFFIELPDLRISCRYSYEQWQQELINIEARFEAFNNPADVNKTAILTHPAQLILLCMAHISRYQTLASGQWHIRVTSKNWLGRGMGSSAAVILATLKAAAKILPLHLKPEQLLKQATEIESYQHGRSSGLDPATLLAKTVIEFSIPGHIHPLGLNTLPLSAWLIDTGKPKTSTGACVSHVRDNFGADKKRWQNFAEVVKQIKHAWQAHATEQFVDGIRRNRTTRSDRRGAEKRATIHKAIKSIGIKCLCKSLWCRCSRRRLCWRGHLFRHESTKRLV
ncbi:hypothetical protein THIOSC13_10008 [uncultured Thiomicrorhabdus sp.]